MLRLLILPDSKHKHLSNECKLDIRFCHLNNILPLRLALLRLLLAYGKLQNNSQWLVLTSTGNVLHYLPSRIQNRWVKQPGVCRDETYEHHWRLHHCDNHLPRQQPHTLNFCHSSDNVYSNWLKHTLIHSYYNHTCYTALSLVITVK